MADSTKVKEITSKLEQGMQDLYSSEAYASYLRTMSRFHKYSTRNTLLIHMQKPEATLVAGFNSWQSNFKRHVKKGEKAIKILAPIPLKITKELEKIDPVTQRPIIGEDGEPVREEVEVKMARFKVVNVFDASQTDGEPLPTLAQDLTGNVEQYEAFMDALRAVSPLPIELESLPEGMDGKCVFGEKISIREGMSEIQTVAAFLHEITHVKLHDLKALRQADESIEPKDRRTEEVEAESIAFCTSSFFGVETGANSFGYIAEWSQGRELKELNASLDTIRKTAAELIEGIEGKFRELVKERNIAYSVGDVELAGSQTEPVTGTAVTNPTVTDTNGTDTNSIDATGTDSIATDILAAYARNAESTVPQRIGAGVLMTPVFEGGNFNRTGKKIRVTVEEPIGKYQIFSRESNDSKQLYFLTASGRIDRTGEYFRDEYDEEARKWVNARPTEAELDEVIPLIAAQFESDMANPTKWAKYQHAAVVDRLDECDAHNTPVRELRNAEDEKRRAEAAETRKEEERRFQEKFDNRVDEIANAVASGNTISVGYDEYAYGGKNPVLELFKLYEIKLPLRTQGWVNTGLAEISASGYRYYSGKHNRNSTVIGGYLKQLRDAIKLTPVEQKRGVPAIQPEVKKTLGKELFDKFAEMFPGFTKGEYSHLRLEAGGGMMPLSLEYVFGDRISIMHTYKLNGDLCYDPMMEFRFDNIGKTMEPVMFEQSIPPKYQFFNDEGVGVSVDGNGNERIVTNLQNQLNSFASMWLDNIGQQGYMPVRGTMEIDGEDVRIEFDAEGKPIVPEQEKPAKEYDLSCGFLGNGITVWNRAEEKNGDYVTVAHISTDRTVKFYDKDMPHEVMQRIDAVAKSPKTQGPGFAPAPESIPPHIENAPAPASAYETAKSTFHEMSELKNTAPDPLLPDPSINISNMNKYGYEWEGMLPLTEARAFELYDSNVAVYLLYPDGTEAMALDRDEIANHEGIFGVEEKDWKHTPFYAKQLAAVTQREALLESELLHDTGNRFGVYQIADGIDGARDFRFASMKELEARGLTVDRANYKLVYTSPFTERVEFLSDRYPVLNNIYSQFNTEPPADYTGRSVSVSDVIVLKCGGGLSTHFVDSAGFKELDNYAFYGEETGRTASMEQPAFSQIGKSPGERANPSVAELESDVKEGKVISLSDLAEAVKAEKPVSNPNGVNKTKPTLMERLEYGKQKAARHGQPDANGSKQKEVE